MFSMYTNHYLDRAWRDLRENGDPFLAQGLAHMQDSFTLPEYARRYVGMTEPSDVTMDSRTFTDEDNEEEYNPIFDAERFQHFVEHGDRGAPFPRADQEPGIPPVWTLQDAPREHARARSGEVNSLMEATHPLVTAIGTPSAFITSPNGSEAYEIERLTALRSTVLTPFPHGLQEWTQILTEMEHNVMDNFDHTFIATPNYINNLDA